MKILLIQPPKAEKSIGGEDFSIFEPLALEYIASGVIGDHEVKILDMRLEDDLESVLNSFQPNVVGITAYTVHVNGAIHLFEKTKKLNPNIFTVVGGHHATVVPEDFINPFIDIVVMGEGVFTFKELISQLEKKGAFDSIPGTAYIKNGKVVINQNNQIDNLDSFPFPHRELTKKYREHYFSEWMKPIASIRTSKGCFFRCYFCALWKLTHGKYLTRKPKNIVEELSQIEEDYVFFADDESLLDKARMEVLADLITKSGIKKHYFFYGRTDTIAKSPELIEKWKKVGLKRIFVGFEFFRDEDLKSIRKGSTPQNNIEAINILHSLDIDIYPTFLVRPEFDKNDFKELKSCCLKLGFNFIGFPVLTPLPGTDFYNEVQPKLITHNYDYFDFFHTLLPTKLPLKEFYKELLSLYNNSRSFSNQIAFLKKYSLKEIPSLFKMFFKFNKQINNLYKDYP